MLMVGVMIVVTALALTGCCLAAYLAAAHRVRSAADLAALSGATAETRGEDGCAAARVAARSNGAEVTRCEQAGDDLDFVLTVRVERSVPILVPGLPGHVWAVAYAGPVR